jgi:hypothetical protein
MNAPYYDNEQIFASPFGLLPRQLVFMNTSGKMGYLMSPLPLVFLLNGKTGYLISRFATDVLFQWQNRVSFDSFCH